MSLSYSTRRSGLRRSVGGDAMDDVGGSVACTTPLRPEAPPVATFRPRHGDLPLEEARLDTASSTRTSVWYGVAMRAPVVFFLFAASCLPLGPPPPARSARSGTVASFPAGRAKPAPPVPTEFKPWELATGSKVDIKVDLSKGLAPITPYHFGNNVACNDSKDWFKKSSNRAAASGI